MSSHHASPAQGVTRAWLLLSSTTMMMGWAKVLRYIFRNFEALQDPNSPVCVESFLPEVSLALLISFLEVFNAVIGVTRSKPHQVLLFSTVRTGVGLLCAPLLSCNAWQHLLTVGAWSLGDTIRFSCFLLDVLVPGGRVAKYVRYNIGPLIFPVGATAEMMMVIAAARDGRPLLYLAAALWPFGFYPLFRQLLRQRSKFMKSLNDKKEE